jgi:hypothetical protein
VWSANVNRDTAGIELFETTTGSRITVSPLKLGALPGTNTRSGEVFPVSDVIHLWDALAGTIASTTGC